MPSSLKYFSALCREIGDLSAD